MLGLGCISGGPLPVQPMTNQYFGSRVYCVRSDSLIYIAALATQWWRSIRLTEFLFCIDAQAFFLRFLLWKSIDKVEVNCASHAAFCVPHAIYWSVLLHCYLGTLHFSTWSRTFPYLDSVAIRLVPSVYLVPRHHFLYSSSIIFVAVSLGGLICLSLHPGARSRILFRSAI